MLSKLANREDEQQGYRCVLLEYRRWGRLRYIYERGRYTSAQRRDDDSPSVVFELQGVTKKTGLIGVVLCVDSSDYGLLRSLHHNFVIGECVEDNCGIGLFYLDVTHERNTVVLNRRAAEVYIVNTKMNNMHGNREHRQSPHSEASTPEEKIRLRKNRFKELDELLNQSLSKKFVEGDYTKRDAACKIALMLYDPLTRNVIYHESPVIKSKDFQIKLTSLQMLQLHGADSQVLQAMMTLNCGKATLSNSVQLKILYQEPTTNERNVLEYIAPGFVSVAQNKKIVTACFSDANTVQSFKMFLNYKSFWCVQLMLKFERPEVQEVLTPFYTVSGVSCDGQVSFEEKIELHSDKTIVLSKDNFLTLKQLQEKLVIQQAPSSANSFADSQETTADVEVTACASSIESMTIVEDDLADQGNLGEGKCELLCDDFVPDQVFAQVDIDKVMIEGNYDREFDLCMYAANEPNAFDFGQDIQANPVAQDAWFPSECEPEFIEDTEEEMKQLCLAMEPYQDRSTERQYFLDDQYASM